MRRYLKAAFWAPWRLPGLGDFPVNAVAMAACAILGFGHPSFWLFGAGLEIAYLSAMVFNSRFRKVVDAQVVRSASGEEEAKLAQLVRQLKAGPRNRLEALQVRCARTLQVSRSTQADEFAIENCRVALKKLEWLYLKLLIAQNVLETGGGTDGGDLKNQIAALERDLQQPGLALGLRESKQATLGIMRKRMETQEQRMESLSVIESDLQRIDAQVNLALENATIQGSPQALSGNITLASHLLDGGMYGAYATEVADLDATFQQPAAAPVKEG